MKKLISIALTLILTLLLFASCSYLPCDYELSLGAVTTEEGGKITETSCALLTDASGRIVLCRIDAVDYKALEDGVKAPLSKKALGDDYNMKTYGHAIAEWYEQAAYYERVMVGKTVEEAMAIVTGSEELASGCTISVDDFARAVKAAAESLNRVALSHFGEVTISLTASTAIIGDGYVSSLTAVAMHRGYTIGTLTDIKEIIPQ